MMILTILSAVAFASPSISSSGTSGWAQTTYVQHVTIGGSALAEKTQAPAGLGDQPIEIDDLIASLETQNGPDFFSEARQWAAKVAYPEKDTLASLRMKMGLSQAQLAGRMDMKQPQLARMERGANINVLTVERLSKALGVSEVAVYAAVKETLRGKIDG